MRFGLEELKGLKSILSRSSVEANLLDNVTMEIVEINYMGQRFIKTCRWLVLDHDHMPIATHQTLEEIEASQSEKPRTEVREISP